MKPVLKKTLLIGPKLDLKRNNVGGATLSFDYLISYFEKEQIPYRVISTQKYPIAGLNLFYVLFALLRNGWQYDVFFANLSQSGMKHLAPLVCLLAKLLGKKIVIRPFGGWMKDEYEVYSSWRQWLFRQTVCQATIFCLQTKALMSYFSSLSPHTHQLPTSRYSPAEELKRGNESYQKRFLFVGHIKASKGINEILEAINSLDNSYIVHLYGPVHDESLQFLLEKKDIYKGILPKEEVAATMKQYDILLLPTYYEGEGYPGAIIEAYSVGLPVISTQWKAIPELVEERETGLLIPPKSAEALVQAMQSIDAENYAAMHQKALDYYHQHFDTDMVMRQLLRLL